MRSSSKMGLVSALRAVRSKSRLAPRNMKKKVRDCIAASIC